LDTKVKWRRSPEGNETKKPLQKKPRALSTKTRFEANASGRGGKGRLPTSRNKSVPKKVTLKAIFKKDEAVVGKTENERDMGGNQKQGS